MADVPKPVRDVLNAYVEKSWEDVAGYLFSYKGENSNSFDVFRDRISIYSDKNEFEIYFRNVRDIRIIDLDQVEINNGGVISIKTNETDIFISIYSNSSDRLDILPITKYLRRLLFLANDTFLR